MFLSKTSVPITLMVVRKQRSKMSDGCLQQDKKSASPTKMQSTPSGKDHPSLLREMPREFVRFQ